MFKWSPDGLDKWPTNTYGMRMSKHIMNRSCLPNKKLWKKRSEIIIKLPTAAPTTRRHCYREYRIIIYLCDHEMIRDWGGAAFKNRTMRHTRDTHQSQIPLQISSFPAKKKNKFYKRPTADEFISFFTTFRSSHHSFRRPYCSYLRSR